MGMASTRRRAHSDLIDELFDQPEQFDFFQTVRLLERAACEQARERSQPTWEPVGHDADPGREIVRFRAAVSLAFPAGSIAELRRQGADNAASPTHSNGTIRANSGPHEHSSRTDRRTDTTNAFARPPEMSVGFLGLTGPSGTLPRHYTTSVIERCHSRHKDTTLRDYLDLFNHRTISLFYRAWRKYRFPFAYEQRRFDPAADPAEDVFTQAVHCLTGIGLPSLQQRMQVPDESAAFFSGHLSNARPSAAALEMMLSEHFGVDVRVGQFVGQWLYLPDENQSSLPDRLHPDGRNLQLGINAVVGARVWDVQSRIRVRLGALTYSEFAEFLPSGSKLHSICEFVRLHVGPELDFEIQPVLRSEDVPACRVYSDPSTAPRLGWNCWMHSRGFSSDVDDACFRPDGLGVV